MIKLFAYGQKISTSRSKLKKALEEMKQMQPIKAEIVAGRPRM